MASDYSEDLLIQKKQHDLQHDLRPSCNLKMK